MERQRLGAPYPPHVVITRSGGAQVVFQNGAWSAPLPNVAVFDDLFIAQNVCAWIEIETLHRQNLHELILDAQGVALSAALQTHVARVEEHNRALRTLGEAIPAAERGALTPDAFCALPVQPNLDAAVQEAERNLAAAQSADSIRQAPLFADLILPTFDLQAINALLSRTLPDLEAAAAANVQDHLAKIGQGAAAWVGDGMQRVGGASAGQDHDVCPFCAQDLAGSPILRHYQAYFSAAYEGLKGDVADTIQALGRSHGGIAPLAFERSVR